MFLLHRILVAAKKQKPHEEIPLEDADLDLLTDLRVAYAKHLREQAREERKTPERKQKEEYSFSRAGRIAPAQEEGEEEGKKKGPPPLWDEFLDEKYNGGSKRVKNTNPKTQADYPEVRVTTLMKTDKAFMQKVMEEYRRWLGEKHDLGDSDAGPKKAKPVFGVKFPDEYPDFEIEDAVWEALGETSWEPEDLLDMAGLAPTKGLKSRITMKGGKFHVEADGRSNDIKVLARIIDFKAKTMVMKNMEIRSDAPKGLGTKIFASQIEKARALGLQKLTCDAARLDPFFNGYKIWPRLGYDGPLPVEETGLPTKFQKALKQAGHKQPWRIQQLYSLGKEAIDWWDKNGDSFDAEFDLQDGSTSMQLFTAYVQKKGGYDKLVSS